VKIIIGDKLALNKMEEYHANKIPLNLQFLQEFKMRNLCFLAASLQKFMLAFDLVLWSFLS